MSCPQSMLPAGFRFHPTDEELILHYLMKKAASLPLPVFNIIAEVDIYKYDPWDLPEKGAFGEKEWYFFSQRDRKYPNGARPNRAAASGYWKATGTDKVIASSSTWENIGVKKALVFYKGKPPKGIKTDWIMHEYRLAEAPNYCNFNPKPPNFRESSSMRLDDWVLCRVYKKSNLSSPHFPPPPVTENDSDQSEKYTRGPTVSAYNNNNILQPQKSSSFSNSLDAMDYTLLNNFLFDNNPDITISSSTVNYSSPEYSYHPLLSNYTTSVNANDTFMQQKPPQMNASIPLVDNRLNKRQLSNHDIDTYPLAKRCAGSSTSGSGTNQFDDSSLYKLFDKAFLGQNVLLSPKTEFQG